MSYSFGQIHTIFNNIQENNKDIFEIKYEGWPIWCILKFEIIKYVNLYFVSNKEVSILKRIANQSTVIFRMVWNTQIAKFQWLYYKRKLKPSKKTAVLLLDGSFHYKNSDGIYVTPFGTDIVINENKIFDFFVIENNNRMPRKTNTLIKSNLTENFASFPGSLKFLFFNKKDKNCEESKQRLINLLKEGLKEYPSIAEAIDRIFERKIINRFLYSFPVVKNKAKKLLRELKPFALIMTPYYGYLGWVAAAKELKIPVVEFQHGIMSKGQPEYTWPGKFRDNKNSLLISDYIYTWGGYSADINKANGFWKDEELIKAGSFKIQDSINRFFKHTLSTDNVSKKTTSIIATFTEFNRADALNFLRKAIEQAISRNINFRIILKLHPHEDFAYKHYKNFETEFPDYFKVYYHKEKHLHELFSEADLHISVFSAAVIEALGLGIPTIIMNLTGKEYFEDLITDKSVKLITEPTDLTELAESVNNNTAEWKLWKRKTHERKEYFFSSNPNKSITEHLNNLSISSGNNQ